MTLKTFPFIRKFYKKIENLQKQIENIEKGMLDLSYQNIQLRYKIKRLLNDKINVVFICHRPAVWGSLKSVYEAMRNDTLFNVKIVTIPNKKSLPKIDLNHEVYMSEGAEDFWIGDNVFSGYDYENKTWFNLSELNPDYVFVQQPYDDCRPEFLKSVNIAKIAKLCYVSYFAFLPNKINDEVNISCNPKRFLKNVCFYFSQCDEDTKLIQNRITNSNTKVIKTGFPGYDYLNYSKDKTETSWKKNGNAKFKVIWTPRWCTNEGNCNFFNYKDNLIKYCLGEDDVSFVFRPHPQAFTNWEASGEFTKDQRDNLIEVFENSNNMAIDTRKEYISTFWESSCLITDISGIIPEYFLTGKPIIYCNNKNTYNTFVKGKGYTSGFYWVENWIELEDTLNMLRRGEDPLNEKRLELIKSEFELPNLGSGTIIKDIIKQDYLNA